MKETNWLANQLRVQRKKMLLDCDFKLDSEALSKVIEKSCLRELFSWNTSCCDHFCSYIVKIRFVQLLLKLGDVHSNWDPLAKTNMVSTGKKKFLNRGVLGQLDKLNQDATIGKSTYIETQNFEVKKKPIVTVMALIMITAQYEPLPLF